MDESLVTLYNKQGVAFEFDGVYCKHCASPANSPENSDTEPEAALSILTTNPEEVNESLPVEEIEEEKPYVFEFVSISTNFVNEVKPVELVHTSRLISTLIWLQYTVFLKEKKRNIFLVVITAAVIGLILFMGLFDFSVYERCPDG